MKSRITIEVDFDNNNAPVIRIKQDSSDDVRDKLVAAFVQNLTHISRWCTITYKGYDDDANTWQITPISPSQIPDEMKLMQSVLNENFGQVAD